MVKSVGETANFSGSDSAKFTNVLIGLILLGPTATEPWPLWQAMHAFAHNDDEKT